MLLSQRVVSRVSVVGVRDSVENSHVLLNVLAWKWPTVHLLTLDWLEWVTESHLTAKGAGKCSLCMPTKDGRTRPPEHYFSLSQCYLTYYRYLLPYLTFTAIFSLSRKYACSTDEETEGLSSDRNAGTIVQGFSRAFLAAPRSSIISWSSFVFWTSSSQPGYCNTPGGFSKLWLFTKSRVYKFENCKIICCAKSRVCSKLTLEWQQFLGGYEQEGN